MILNLVKASYDAAKKNFQKINQVDKIVAILRVINNSELSTFRLLATIWSTSPDISKNSNPDQVHQYMSEPVQEKLGYKTEARKSYI